MAGIKNQMLRLRRDTVDKLQFALQMSTHRSMSALADELLSQALDKRIDALNADESAARTIRSLVRRDG
jgi:hypothetical protein